MKRPLMALLLLALSVASFSGEAQDLRRVVINEIAWSGSAASSSDEWIELVNNSDRDIDLTGWVLRWEGRAVHFGPVEAEVENNAQEVRSTIIPARGFYLLERTDDDTISDIEADLIYTGSLRNGGEQLELLDDQGNVVDTANTALQEGWLAGSAGAAEVPYATMERRNSRSADSSDNWASNTGAEQNGLDADGNPINGTPKSRNSTRR